MDKKIKIITVATACALLISILSAAVWTMFSDIKNEVGSSDAQSAIANVSRGRFNLLVAGTDRTSGLTDVMMLLSLDRDANTVSILQIPRDTYAAYTDKSYKKLNGAYGALGGGRELANFISDAFAIKIDRYAVLSPDALRAAVDAVGGVEIELDEPLYYRDPHQGLSISLPKGKQILNGERAEQFIRYRSGYASGDIGRMDAQKVFMTALFKKLSTELSPLSLAKLASGLIGKTDTDITPADIGMLSRELSSIGADKVYFVTAPGEAADAKSGASYYALSKSAMDRLLSERFGGTVGSFDKKEVFLNKNNKAFGSIYESEREYTVYSAENIAENGLGNASAP